MKEHFSNSDIKGESTKNLGNINQTFRQRIYNNLKILLLRFDLFHLDYIWFLNAALSAIRVPLRKATIEEEEGPFKTKQVSFLFSAIQGFQSTSKKGRVEEAINKFTYL